MLLQQATRAYMMNIDFSNSLTIIIIYEKKTKEITTVKEVWICDPNYQNLANFCFEIL